MGRHRSTSNESDVRRKYRSLMDEERHRFPRKSVLSHRMEWYFDGHLVTKPLVAVYAYANLAEYFLHFTRFGRRHQDGAVRAAEEFFALTRRSMQNVLSTYPIGRRLTPAERESVSRVAERLLRAAELTRDEIRVASTPCECPACRGSAKRMPASDAELLEAILCEQSKLGRIPPTSKLFRASAIDKLPRTVI